MEVCHEAGTDPGVSKDTEGDDWSVPWGQWSKVGHPVLAELQYNIFYSVPTCPYKQERFLCGSAVLKAYIYFVYLHD